MQQFESAVLVEKFLSSIGISDVKEIVYNPSYDQLYEDELQPGLEGFARGYLTELGAVNVLTGEYTGRSPKDKFIVKDETTRDSYWWNGNGTKNDNKPIDTAVWNDLKALAAKQLSGKKTLYRRRILWCQQRHLYEGALCYGSCLAGAFRQKYVYPAKR